MDDVEIGVDDVEIGVIDLEIARRVRISAQTVRGRVLSLRGLYRGEGRLRLERPGPPLP